MVLTGFNTDIEHAGVTYHVQTEDKGRANPFVESLVCARGEILYSRRTSYQGLVDQKVDRKALASLLERQHRSIVEAIRRGRLTELTAEGDSEPAADDQTIISAAPADEGPPSGDEPSLDQVILDYLAAQRGRAHLVLQASGDQDFVYGQTAQVRVTAAESHTDSSQEGVSVAVLFKSTAEPRRLLLAEGTTDENGSFEAQIRLPEYNGGTSAVVITADSKIGQSEIKHLVHQ